MLQEIQKLIKNIDKAKITLHICNNAAFQKQVDSRSSITFTDPKHNLFDIKNIDRFNYLGRLYLNRKKT